MKSNLFLLDYIFVLPGIAGILIPGHLCTKASYRALNSRNRRSSLNSESPEPFMYMTPVTVYSVCAPPIPLLFYFGLPTVNRNILGSDSTFGFKLYACFSGTLIFFTFSKTSVLVCNRWRSNASSAIDLVRTFILSITLFFIAS